MSPVADYDLAAYIERHCQCRAVANTNNITVATDETLQSLPELRWQ